MNVQIRSDCRMGENGERPGCRLSAGNENPRHRIQHHDRPDNARQLGQMTGRVKAKAKQTYGRDLRMAKEARYTQISLLATICYTAQIFTAPAT